jgi:hypothetical protein
VVSCNSKRLNGNYRNFKRKWPICGILNRNRKRIKCNRCATVIWYRGPLLSPPQAGKLYRCIERPHPPGRPVKASVFGVTMK